MRAMRPTLAGFQLAFIVLLAIIPFISATPSQPAGSFKCPDNPGVICGDSDDLDLHRSGFARNPDPTIVQQFEMWFYIGCLPDSNEQRTLTIPMTGGINSVSYCLTACKDARYYLAGMESGSQGGECWCANTLPFGIKKGDDKSCNTVCPGNLVEYCGGVHNIQVYAFTGLFGS